MVRGEIASVVWHQLDHHIDVIYVEGEPDRMVGALIVAAELAENAGLRIVSTPGGTVRWVQNPETWHGPQGPAP